MARKRRKKRGGQTKCRAGQYVQVNGLRVYVDEIAPAQVVLRIRADGKLLTKPRPAV